MYDNNKLRRRLRIRRSRAVSRGKAAKHAEEGEHVRTETPTMTGAVARRLKSLRTKGGIKDIELANLLGTRPETVSRWNHGRAYPRVKTEKTLRDLEYIIDRLADFYEPNEARQWIFAPQKLLGGVSPAELIRSRRIDEVMRLVGQLRDAVHH
jgi:ribosome-binding protein aMBF1 (putative translation factor)